MDEFERFEKEKEERRRVGHKRRGVAEDDFEEAEKLARKNNLVLKKCTQNQYNFHDKEKTWLIQLYPGNNRIYSPPNKRFRYLGLPKPWRLIDVVVAVVDIITDEMMGSSREDIEGTAHGEAQCASCGCIMYEKTESGLCETCCTGEAPR